MRPLCKVCSKNPAAINGYHRDKIYYRSRCNACIRRDRRQKKQRPRWELAGYKKKAACDRCGFKARHHTQLTVYHVNGDLNDCELRNLKTVCLNCIAEITRLDLPWRAGDLEPDR
jgi:hypothetical protein